MATWVRNATGANPNGTDADVLGTQELDNGTAPGDFDPGAVNSVRIQYDYEIKSGSFTSPEDHTVLRFVELNLNGVGSVIASVDGTNVDLDAGSDPVVTDEIDNSPSQAFSIAQWETAELNPGDIATVRAWSEFNQNMSKDGVNVGIASASVIVTIDYEPDTGTNYDETGLSVAVTSSVTGTDTFDAVDSGTVAITSTVTGTDVHLSPVLELKEFRFRDGTDAAGLNDDSDWGGALNADLASIDVTGDYTLRLRITVVDTVVAIPATSDYRLDYRVNGGTWFAIGSGSGVTDNVGSAQYIFGDPTTQLIGSGTFVTGEGVVFQSFAENIALDVGEETEIEWALGLVAAELSNGDDIDFRLSYRTTGAWILFDTFTETPSIAVIKGTTYDETGLTVAITSTVTGTDGLAYALESFTVNITSTVTGSDTLIPAPAGEVVLTALYDHSEDGGVGDPWVSGTFDVDDGDLIVVGFGGVCFTNPNTPGNVFTLTDSEGQSWTKIVNDELIDEGGIYSGVLSVWWAIADADLTGMTVTVNDDDEDSYGYAFAVFKATGHDPISPITQVSYDEDDTISGDNTEHTATLDTAPALGSAVVGMFFSQNDATGAYTVPTGFDSIINNVDTSCHPGVFWRDDTTSTDIYCTDLGQSIFFVQSAALEIEVGGPQTFDETGLVVNITSNVTGTDVHDAPLSLPFIDEFTDTNGEPWDTARWTTGEQGTGAATDIQSNEGRMHTGNAAEDWSAATANAATDLQDSKVLLYIDPNAVVDGTTRWLYVCLRSSGERDAGNAGRPDNSYYIRLDVTDDTNFTRLYRKIDPTETDLSETDNSRIGNNVPIWVRAQVYDVGADTKIQYRIWDDGQSEPTSWDVDRLDVAPGALHGVTGVFQLALRQFNNTDSADVRIDHVEYDEFTGATFDETGLTVAVVATVTGTDTLSGGFPFNDEFTDTNGEPWDTGKWVTSELGQTAAETDIQSNEGRMMSEGDRNDYNSCTVISTPDVQDSQVLLYVDPSNNSGTTDDHWLYIMLRSTGEQVSGNAGRPATAYYIRAEVNGTDFGVNLYRRIDDDENALSPDPVSRIDPAVPFWVRMEVEDVGSDVMIRGSLWDDGESEPGTWDFEELDLSSGDLFGAVGTLQLVNRNYSNLGEVNDVRIDSVDYVTIGAVVYDETGKTVAITSAVTGTDVASLTDEGASVAIVSTITGTDAIPYDETGPTVAITSTVTGTDALAYALEALTVAIVSTVTGTDTQHSTESLTVAITSSVTGTDALAYALEALQIDITSTVTGTDTHNVGAINYDETGKSVAIVSSVTGTESITRGELGGTVAITSTVTGTDVASLVESATVAITSTVTGTDGLAYALESLTVAITSTVTGTDVASLVGSFTVDIISNVTGTDTLIHEGVFDETGKFVNITSTVTGTDVASLTDVGKTVAIVATVTGTDARPYDETGKTVAITSTVTGTDGKIYTEAGTVAIVSVVTGTDVAAYVEAGVVVITSTVTGTDTHNISGIDYDETGLDVAIVSAVTATDVGAFVESAQVDITSTVTGTESLAYTETGGSVDITSTVTGTDGIGRVESLTVAITSGVTGTDVGAFVESGIVTGNASVSSSDVMSAIDSLSIAITSTVTGTDSTFSSSIGVGTGPGLSTEGSVVGYSGEADNRGKSSEGTQRGKTNGLQSLGRTT